MARLPNPGSDQGTWGNILNEFLAVAHNTDGTLKPGADIADGAITTSKLANGAVTQDKIVSGLIDPAAGVAGLRTLGNGANQAMPGNATVTAGPHAASHKGDGADPIAVASTSVSGLMSATDKSKLDGVASGATANSSDATLLSRANHTGSQPMSTISDAGNAATRNVGTTAGTVAAGDDSRLTNARTPTAHAASHKGGGSDPIDTATTSVSGLLSAADKTKLDGVATGATANSADATLLNRANHTGTQTMSTISDAGNAATRSVGTTAGTVAAGDDSRFSDARSPTAHAASHKGGGADAIDSATGSVAGLMSAGDKTKLDAIEANADVTDAANVAAAGAVMEADTSTSAMQFVVDEDNMASNSDTKLPTQQSVKQYVDTQVATAGDVKGPASATDNAITRFDTTTGKLIQNSSVTIDDGGIITTSGVIKHADGVAAGDSATKGQLDAISAAKMSRSIVSTSGNTPAGAVAGTDYVYLVTGAHTVTLPTAIGNTNRYTVKNNHSAAITVDTTSSQTIDGTTTISVPPANAVDIISNNANWSIL